MKHSTIKKLAGIAFLSLTGISVFSQEQQTSTESRLSPKFGIKGGVNLSNLYVDNVDDENMKVGGNIGFFVKLPVTQGFSIQPEVIYSMKGAQLNYNNFALGSGKYKFNLDYIEIPVLAVFNVAKNFNLHVGGYGSFLISAKVKDVDKNGDINGITELDKNNFQTFDYGLIGGLGIDVSNVTLGARYNYGLREIGKSGISGQVTQNSKNSVISLYVGFGF